MTYQEQLWDPRWRILRLIILKRDEYCCRQCYPHLPEEEHDERTRRQRYLEAIENCGEEVRREMHVHHIRYLPGKMAWDYPHRYLITLCDGCHEEAHQVISNGRTPFRQELPDNGSCI